MKLYYDDNKKLNDLNELFWLVNKNNEIPKRIIKNLTKFNDLKNIKSLKILENISLNLIDYNNGSLKSFKNINKNFKDIFEWSLEKGFCFLNYNS